jgi:hypothetical protein
MPLTLLTGDTVSTGDIAVLNRDVGLKVDHLEWGGSTRFGLFSKKWILGDFTTALRAEFKRTGLGKFKPEKAVCAHFAAKAWIYAQECHRMASLSGDRAVSDAAVAKAFFWKAPENHALTLFYWRNAQKKLHMMLYEPQHLIDGSRRSPDITHDMEHYRLCKLLEF